MWTMCYKFTHAEFRPKIPREGFKGSNLNKVLQKCNVESVLEMSNQGPPEQPGVIELHVMYLPEVVTQRLLHRLLRY